MDIRFYVIEGSDTKIIHYLNEKEVAKQKTQDRTFTYYFYAFF